tara:strand:- start:193 stop:882 length:690 start_codon:yes stop_codon:yes gene_type:complete
MNVCLIPARKNSKRIKNKNIISFFGKPLIAYAIETAKKSNLFDKIIVSTDSKKIAQIAKKYGAETPFLRPKKISSDFANDNDVINHFVKFYNSKNIKINYLCYLYPVNPLLKISTLVKCKKLLEKNNCHKVMTIAKFDYPIQRGLVLNARGNLSFLNNKYKNYRSQDLTQCYQDAAQCYWYNLKKIKKLKTVKTMKTKAIVLKSFEFCDVDTHNDLQKLRKIFQYKLMN